MPKLIVVLEDNTDRVHAMKKRLEDRLSMYEHFITDDPHELIGKLRERMDDVLALSLDHDLHERPDASTVLTGMMVADFLATQQPRFPIILHTSNTRDGETMKSRLVVKGWKVTWVTPFLDTAWVGDDWYPTLKRAIRRSAKTDQTSGVDDRN